MPIPGYCPALHASKKEEAMSDTATQNAADRAFKFGDPVWVTDRDGVEREGYYGEKGGNKHKGYNHWCLWELPNGIVTLDWFKDIRPRQLSTPPVSGWRLPEPGDVVRVKDSAACHSDWKGIEITLQEPISKHTGYTIRHPGIPEHKGTYNFTPYELELIRTKDEPEANPNLILSPPLPSLPLTPFADLISSVLNQYPDELVRNTALAALKVLISTTPNRPLS